MRWLALPWLLLATAPAARAGGLETLVMPGPLSAAHADVESECGRCHRAFEASAENRLCLACHEPVALDLEQRSGMHGRATSSGSEPCRSCHTEHRGRDADILALSPAAFDHAQTDFALEGAHRAAGCAACHVEDAPHRDAPSDCLACHESDDAHQGALGEVCGDCHRAASWRSASFDHAGTRFPLTGAHAEADCGLCHPSERYAGTPSACGTCHASDDAHRGRLGEACGDCHDAAGWRTAHFDHDRETRFPLEGAHRRARCDACHGASAPASGNLAGADCRTCHAADDDHDGAFGVRCETCHSPRAFRGARFDHQRRTGFRLAGAHAALDCTSCHRGILGQEQMGTRCGECHRASDAHAGQLGTQCGKCHASRSWTQDVSFDHDLARFPLLGLHVVADCRDCHRGSRFHDASERCSDCHAKDDRHEGGLGDDCARCHNPNGWALWRFDHGRDTDFALRGGHEGIACSACHAGGGARARRVGSRCETCHAPDDPHRGRFGTRCETCHVESSWQSIRLGR